jgi:hypothetical protein
VARSGCARYLHSDRLAANIHEIVIPMSDIIDHSKYLEMFPEGKIREEALKYAHDIRKFEIELYWKRATYFWTFIAAAFAGYFTLQKEGDLANLYVVCCLGFTFSLALYLVNRGSGAWQRNWERHVDLLEDGITGPLHKTLINRRTYKLHHFAEPYAFSPSRINNMLSLSITIVWVILAARTLWKIGIGELIASPTVVLMTIFTASFTVLLCWKGYSRKSDDPLVIRQRVRMYS